MVRREFLCTGQKLLIANVCPGVTAIEFPQCVCGCADIRQTGRHAASGGSTETGNCYSGVVTGLGMTEFWVCFSCCIAEQPQPVSILHFHFCTDNYWIPACSFVRNVGFSQSCTVDKTVFKDINSNTALAYHKKNLISVNAMTTLDHLL